MDAMRLTLLEAWSELGADGGGLVEPLKEIVLEDPSLLHVELASLALAVQGEDGITGLLDCLESHDATIRHKALIGVGVLGRGARWAVPRLIHLLTREQHSLVVESIVDALGRIGGVEAVAALEELRKARPQDAGLIDNALRTAAIEDVIT